MESCPGDVGEVSPESLRFPERLARPDSSPLENPDVDALGLSVLLPGILDLSARNDLVDSLVSALLKDGYDWRSSLLSEVCEALLGVPVPVPLEF